MKFTHFAKNYFPDHDPIMPNTRDPVSLRLDPKLHLRLQAAADLIDLPKHSLCQAAIEAVVSAIEAHKGLVLPVEFIVRRVPATKKLKSARQAV